MDAKIVRLEINDTDPIYRSNTVACFYLLNPDMDRLKAIRTMIETRFDDLEADPTFGCISEVEDLLRANFSLIPVSTESIEWQALK